MGNVSSGSIKVLDSESFYIPNLFLTIPEAGYNFYVGNSSDSRPNDQGQSVRTLLNIDLFWRPCRSIPK